MVSTETSSSSQEAALAGLLGGQSPLARRVARLVGEAQRGDDEAPVAVGLEQVERLLVGEVGVVDDAEAVADAHLDGVRAAGVGAHPHAGGAGDLHGRGHLGVGHHGAVGALVALPRLARDVELQEIDALSHEEAADLPDLVGPIGDPGEGRRLEMGQVQRVLVAEPARDRDLRAIGEVARAGDAPGIDLVPDHDVEPGLGRGARQHARVAALEHGPGIAHGDEDVLLGRQARELRVRGGVGVADVAVGLHEPGHQRGAGAVDDARAAARQAPAHLHRGDALALDQHVTGKRRGPAAIENHRVDDQRPVHGLLLGPHDSTRSGDTMSPAPRASTSAAHIPEEVS